MPRKKSDGREAGSPSEGLDAVGAGKSWRTTHTEENFHRASDVQEVIRLGTIINDPKTTEKAKKKAAADILKNYGLE